MWTINDFPAYGMLSGWSTHGKLACPYCMENNKAFTLANGGKASFFYCHRCFLPLNHRYRKNRKDFFVGRVEKDVASPRLSCRTSKIRAASADDFSFVRFALIGSLESPPSNLLKATRKPGYWSYQRFAGKGLVVVREGISTPNAPYLR